MQLSLAGYKPAKQREWGAVLKHCRSLLCSKITSLCCHPNSTRCQGENGMQGMPIHGAQKSVFSQVGGTSKAHPALGVALGAPFPGLQSREGGIGLDSRSCSCSPPGCLSPCPVSGPAHIKHYCSQPSNCQGSSGRTASRLTALGTPRVLSHTHTDLHRCKQRQGPAERVLKESH